MILVARSRRGSLGTFVTASFTSARAGDQVVICNPYIEVRPSATFSSILHSQYTFAPHY